jgi:excisionase family DNA binding protein
VKKEAPDDMLSVSEVHALLGKDKISRSTIYAAARRGALPHLRVGTRILISRAYIKRQLEGMQEK